MNSIRRAGLLTALVVLVGMLAACTATDPRLEDEFTPSSPTATRNEAVIIANGTDVTIGADESVDLLIVSNGTARIEGDASTIWVVNGGTTMAGGHADSVVAIQSQVTLDPASTVSGDIRTFESDVTGATATTVTGRVRDFGPDMFLGWRDWAPALALIYLAFVVSAVMAGVVLAALAGRQVRAAGTLITKEPLAVVAAGIVGLIAILAAGTLAAISVLGIPFAIGLLALALPGLFVIGYIVMGIWVGERILGQTSTVERERPYLAALVGLTVVGVVSIIPTVGGLISFVGFGAVMLLSWRVLRGTPGAVPAAATMRVADAAS
jgi:hypothetical protein